MLKPNTFVRNLTSDMPAAAHHTGRGAIADVELGERARWNDDSEPAVLARLRSANPESVTWQQIEARDLCCTDRFLGRSRPILGIRHGDGGVYVTSEPMRSEDRFSPDQVLLIQRRQDCGADGQI